MNKINEERYDDYLREHQRTYDLSEMLRTRLGFKLVGINYPNKNHYRKIEVSFDGITWKCLNVYANSPDYEILQLMRDTLINGKWDDSYILNPHSITLKNIIETYRLDDVGCQQIRNKFCKLNHDTINMDEIADTENIKEISLKFDNDGYLTSLVLATNDSKIIVDTE